MTAHTSVPGWFFHEALFRGVIPTLPDDAEVVEVGSWKGRSAVFIASMLEQQDRGMRLTCVDHWQGSDEPDHEADEDVKAGRLYEVFRTNTAPFKCIRPLRMASVEAASTFPDGSIYLLYLDASHDEDSVTADIAAWWPKVALGGWLIGDDWNWPGVAAAAGKTFGDNIVTVGAYPAWVVRKQEAEQGASHSADDHDHQQTSAGC